MVAERKPDRSWEPPPLHPHQSLSSLGRVLPLPLLCSQALFPEPREVVLPFLAFAKFSMVGVFTGLIEDSSIATTIYKLLTQVEIYR